MNSPDDGGDLLPGGQEAGVPQDGGIILLVLDDYGHEDEGDHLFRVG